MYLNPDSVVVQAGMPLNTKPKVFRNAKTVDILKVALPASTKIDIKNTFVGKVTGSAGMAMMFGGDADDSRLMWVSVRGEHAYVLKRLDMEAPKFPVVGELHDAQGKMNITPMLRVQTGSGVVSIPVDSIVTPQSTDE